MKRLIFLLLIPLSVFCGESDVPRHFPDQSAPLVVLKHKYFLSHSLPNESTAWAVPNSSVSNAPNWGRSQPLAYAAYMNLLRNFQFGLDLPSESKDRWYYFATLENVGNREVKYVAWDYVLTDPDTQKEISRRHFANKTNIGSGKKKQLTAISNVPPSLLVDIRELQTHNPEKPLESIAIVQVGFADGGIWASPFRDQTANTPTGLATDWMTQPAK